MTRPKSYKVEATPPLQLDGHRLCNHCNGHVRPQKCGGSSHRWRCVDKACRKWYGWVQPEDEIPKDMGTSGKWKHRSIEVYKKVPKGQVPVKIEIIKGQMISKEDLGISDAAKEEDMTTPKARKVTIHEVERLLKKPQLKLKKPKEEPAQSEPSVKELIKSLDVSISNLKNNLLDTPIEDTIAVLQKIIAESPLTTVMKSFMSQNQENTKPLVESVTKKPIDDPVMPKLVKELAIHEQPISPLTDEQINYSPSALESEVRWWGKTYPRKPYIAPSSKHLQKPQIDVNEQTIPSMCKIIEESCRAAADLITEQDRGDEAIDNGSATGFTDMMMDTTFSSMGQLFYLASFLPLMNLQDLQQRSIMNLDYVPMINK